MKDECDNFYPCRNKGSLTSNFNNFEYQVGFNSSFCNTPIFNISLLDNIVLLFLVIVLIV